MMRALGMEERLPLAPAPSRKAPIEAARPKQKVWTSDLHICSQTDPSMRTSTQMFHG